MGEVALHAPVDSYQSAFRMLQDHGDFTNVSGKGLEQSIAYLQLHNVHR